MKLNTEQRKYLADICKIIAVAQFGVVGYTGFTQNIPHLFVGSGLVFAMFVYFGLRVLDGGQDE
jgi:hypothetical protein